MGKKQLLSEQEALKKLAKEDKIVSEKTRKNRRDAWTAVAVLAMIMLLAVGLSFYKTSNIEIKKYSGKSIAKEHEKAEKTKKVIVGLGILCGGVLIIALVNRSKNKTSKLSKSDIKKLEQKRLDDARARVEAAKRNRLDEEAMGASARSRNRNESFGNQSNNSLGDKNHFNDLDIEDRAAYLERRKKEYQYYMDNDLNDEETNDTEFSESNIAIRKKVNKLNNENKKYLYIGLGVLAAILLAGLIVFIVL